jgi:hypothetical protein
MADGVWSYRAPDCAMPREVSLGAKMLTADGTRKIAAA